MGISPQLSPHSNFQGNLMSQTKVSIGFDQKSREYFARLLGNRPVVAGAHCSDDDDDSEKKIAFGALGAHCSDDGDDDGDKPSVRFGNIALGAHCSDDDEEDDVKKIAFGQIAFGAHCTDDGDEDDCDKKHHLSSVYA